MKKRMTAYSTNGIWPTDCRRRRPRVVVADARASDRLTPFVVFGANPYRACLLPMLASIANQIEPVERAA